MAWADTVTLKNGDVIEGKILKESETEVTINTIVSAGISDDQTIQKSEISMISKVTEDEVAYESLKWYKVGRDSFQLGAYEPMMRAIEVFLGRHGTSGFANELKENLYALRDENAKVKKGEVKWNDRWYSKDEGAKLQYQIAGQRAYAQMREKAVRGDAIAALNAFTFMDRDYPGSRDYPDAVELALAIIPKVVGDADRRTNDSKRQQQQFLARIDSVGEPERTRLINSNNASIAAAQAAYAAAERAQFLWKPVLPLDERSVTSLKATAGTELPRLRALNLTDMRESIKLAIAIEDAIASKNVPVAEEKLKSATALWPANERLEHLSNFIKSLKEEQAASAAANTPKPGQSTAGAGSK